MNARHATWTLYLGLALASALAANRAALAKDPPVDANSAAAASAAASAGMDAELLAKIPARMLQFSDEGQFSGAVTLVARQGKIVHLAAVGEADVATHRPMTIDTLFAVASMTKPITATALMILVDEGKVGLDDPASKYVPEFKQSALKTGTPKREITVRDLLTHTSGLIGEQRNEGTLAETAAKMAARPLAFEPGSKWQYGPSITICGRIVEVASGMPFEKFLEQRIFEPLGMYDTTFLPTPEQQPRVARLYQPGKDGKGLARVEHWINDMTPGKTPNPSGGLFSKATDMARFYQMVLGGGQSDGPRILSAKAVEEMTRVQTGDMQAGFTPGNAWGLGWCVQREPQGVSRMLSPGSFGHGGAFGTQGWVDPQKQMIFVLLIQRTGFGNSDGSAIREAFQQLAVDAIKN